MSVSLTFDDLDEQQTHAVGNIVPPYQHRSEIPEYTDDLVWLNDYFNMNYEGAKGRFRVYRYHLELFKGVHWRELRDTNYNAHNLNVPFNPRHAINFIYDTIDARATLRSKRKSNLSFIPNDQDSISDINNAKACRMLYMNRVEEIKLDAVHRKADQHVDLFGDCFLFVVWDPMAGGMGEDGKRLGDVVVKLVPPNRVFTEIRSDKYAVEDLDFIEYTEWVNIYALKAQYPDEMENVTSDQTMMELDLLEGRQHNDEALVHHFFHKKTPFMPEGRYIIYIESAILYEGPLPYDHGGLPVVHDGDIEIPERVWHQSFITQVEQLQRTYNNVYSSVVRDFGYNGPKWMVPAGSKVKQAALNPGHNLVEYHGERPPELITYPSTNFQNFEFLSNIKDNIYSLGKVYDISRGVVPKGVTANSALRFLDEQETRRSDVLFAKKAERIVAVGNLMISVMAQYYKPDASRVVRSLGENNQYLIKDFKANRPNFKKIHSVKAETASSLPDTKSGRISAIVELNTSTQTDPIFSRNEVIQLLDLGLDERFRNAATVAVTTAKEMIAMMLEGVEVPPLEESDDLLVYYNVFEIFMQSVNYKNLITPEMKAQFQEVVSTIEGFLHEKAKVNPKMLQMVSQLEYFPRYFTPDIPLSQLTMDSPPAEMGGAGIDTKQVENLQKQTAEPEGATK